MDNSKFNLPTPQMLIKKAKEETIPVSLRVKESTVAIFDKMAKEAGVNRGAMMNTWLDFYAQNQGASDRDNSLDIMKSYLSSEARWRSLAMSSPERLIYRMPTLIDENYNGFHLNGEMDIRYLYEQYKKKDIDDDTIVVAFIGDDSIMPTDDKPHCDANGGVITLYVTFEQWPMVSVLLGEYAKKYQRLFPEQEYIITEDIYKKIAYFCNSATMSIDDIANAIRVVLLEYVVTQNG